MRLAPADLAGAKHGIKNLKYWLSTLLGIRFGTIKRPAADSKWPDKEWGDLGQHMANAAFSVLVLRRMLCLRRSLDNHSGHNNCFNCYSELWHDLTCLFCVCDLMPHRASPWASSRVHLTGFISLWAHIFLPEASGGRDSRLRVVLPLRWGLVLERLMSSKANKEPVLQPWRPGSGRLEEGNAQHSVSSVVFHPVHCKRKQETSQFSRVFALFSVFLSSRCYWPPVRMFAPAYWTVLNTLAH